MLFDFIMMRFEPEYNPEIIYDASCLVKEYDSIVNFGDSCLFV